MQNLIQNIDKIRTTQMGLARIIKNIGICRQNSYSEIINFCREIINNPSAKIIIRGKNYYIESNDIILTINRHSFTIITAHKK